MVTELDGKIEPGTPPYLMVKSHGFPVKGFALKQSNPLKWGASWGYEEFPNHMTGEF